MGSEVRSRSEKDALAALERMCARSERCQFDAWRLLRRWNVDETSARNVVDTLVRDGFIDDARYAEAYARDKVRFARWGSVKISSALRAKHIPQSVIDRVLGQFSREDARSAVETLVRDKLRSIGGEMTRKNRDKCFRFALQRGYEFELVSDVCFNIFKE